MPLFKLQVIKQIRMKKTFTLITLLFSIVTLSAQDRSNIYIIKFSDKGQSGYSISNPGQFLSERSVERRLLQHIPLNETDLPVSSAYLQNLKKLGAEVIYTSKWLNVAIANVSNESNVMAIKALPYVRDINKSSVLDRKTNHQPFKRFFQQEKFHRIDLHKDENNTKAVMSYNYGLSGNQAKMLKVDQLHNQGYAGEGMTIAVIDAGFNSANTLDVFDSLYAKNRILGTKDFVQPGNNVYNNTMSLHGTMVLSTMGGNLPGAIVGTAPHASFYLLRSEDASAEYLMEEYYWVNAAEYADSIGADLINSSLGYTVFDNPADSHTYADMDGNTAVVTIAADMAAQKGILVVSSAGNDGNKPWHYISAPADGDSVLTIGAVDSLGLYANFSSVGPTADGRVKPDVAAQGSSVIVAVIPSGISWGSGTSFSSPILCGAAACLWQANPTYSNMEIYNAIKQSGSRASNPNDEIGWGIPDFVLANSLLVGNIDRINYSYEIKCYPNPFSDYVTAEFNLKSKSEAEIRLINTQGTVLKSFKGIKLFQGKNSVKFEDLNLLPKGIYFIQILDAHGIITQKIIK